MLVQEAAEAVASSAIKEIRVLELLLTSLRTTEKPLALPPGHRPLLCGSKQPLTPETG